MSETKQQCVYRPGKPSLFCGPFDESDVLPTGGCYSLTSTLEHFWAEIYSDDVARLGDTISDQGKAETGTAGNVQNDVTGPQVEPTN